MKQTLFIFKSKTELFLRHVSFLCDCVFLYREDAQLVMGHGWSLCHFFFLCSGFFSFFLELIYLSGFTPLSLKIISKLCTPCFPLYIVCMKFSDEF